MLRKNGLLILTNLSTKFTYTPSKHTYAPLFLQPPIGEVRLPVRRLLFGWFVDFSGDAAVCAGGACQCASTDGPAPNSAPNAALISRDCKCSRGGIAGWGLAAGAVSSL